MHPDSKPRILLVDDDPAIHLDYRKILGGTHTPVTNAKSRARPAAAAEPGFELESAYQGREALEKLLESESTEQPFALAFVDMNMPPGWDGVETIEHLWRANPMLQIVICTACDLSWEKMRSRLGPSDNLLILKKPFDTIEVRQLAHTLTRKWVVTRQAEQHLELLDKMVSERTRDLQQKNEELSRSEERFAKAFLNSPIPLAIQALDDDRFVDVNDAFALMTGFERVELVGRTPVDVRICIDYEPRAIQSLREGKLVRNAQAQVSTRDGDIREALVSLERIFLDEEPHVLVMIQDVSHQVRMETQLRQSQKMEAVGQFAAGIAHDFNNLLTIIEGHTSLQLGAPGLPKDVSDSLEEIEDAAERAANLTRQLLAFSRPRMLRPHVLNLNDVVKGMSEMLDRMLGERFELQCELAEDLPQIRADHSSLEQVLMNLTLNARDAMPEGGAIRISTSLFRIRDGDAQVHPDAQPGEHVCLSVADQGVGMDAETRSRAFEPFFTTKETSKGSGMGLASVYGVTRQHHGWVEVESTPGAGSIFHVRLPVSREPAKPEPAAPAPAAPVRRDHTILIVEDDQAVRSLVKDVLMNNDYRVIEAENADEALQLWPQCRDEVELLLTDMVMPGSADGLELAEMLTGDKPELKVIYTSGYSTDLFASDIELQSGRNYLPKPYLSNALTDILRQALDPIVLV